MSRGITCVGTEPTRERARERDAEEDTAKHAPSCDLAGSPVATKLPVVDMMLDSVGYLADGDLSRVRLLDPSCGRGGFVVRAAERLLESVDGRGGSHLGLDHAITAFEIEPTHAAAARERVRDVLLARGLDPCEADRLASSWIRIGDFLRADLEPAYDAIIGNPPQGRLERLPPQLAREYRERFHSLRDRADLAAAFVERGVSLLGSRRGRRGRLSLIVPSGWFSSRSGAALRRLVTQSAGLRAIVDLRRVEPFDRQVGSYPSVIVMEREAPGPVRVVTLESVSNVECAAAAAVLTKPTPALRQDLQFHEHDRWFDGSEPWTLAPPKVRDLLQRLSRFPPVNLSARVGIGVTTGADDVFIVGDGADVEADRLVPITLRDDVPGRQHGRPHRRRYVINTFDEEGRVIDLARYPRLRRYLEHGQERLRGRYVARQAPSSWFRTIDRLDLALVAKPKLIVPDLARDLKVSLIPGGTAIHHNLTYVTSERWDLRVLGGILSSRIASLVAGSYAPRGRGGYLRLGPQTIKTLPVPPPESIAPPLARKIADAFEGGDQRELHSLVCSAYGIDGHGLP